MSKLKSLIAVLCCASLLVLQGCSDHEKSTNTSKSTESTATADSTKASAGESAELPPMAAMAKKATEAMTKPAAKPAPAKPEQTTTTATTAAAATPAPASKPQPAAAGGATHVVRVQLFSFIPQVLFIKPGDTVEWVGMQAGHNSASIKGMIPEGAEAWRSAIGQNFSITLTKPGAYVYKCEPHFSLGMLGAIVVGDTPPANMAAIENSPDNKGQVGVMVRKLKKALAQHK